MDSQVASTHGLLTGNSVNLLRDRLINSKLVQVSVTSKTMAFTWQQIHHTVHNVKLAVGESTHLFILIGRERPKEMGPDSREDKAARRE